MFRRPDAAPVSASAGRLSQEAGCLDDLAGMGQKPRDVREAAGEYFGDSWSRDPDLVPMILEACDRDGFADNLSGLSLCERFPLTGPAFDAVLAALDRAEDERTTRWLNRIIASAPTHWFSELIRSIAKLLSEMRIDSFSRTRRMSVCASSLPVASPYA